MPNKRPVLGGTVVPLDASSGPTFPIGVAMNEDTLKQDIVQDLDGLSPDKLKEVRDFIESLRRSQSTSSIFAEIDESIRSISDDEWEEVPADASKRLDDDLYGPSDA